MTLIQIEHSHLTKDQINLIEGILNCTIQSVDPYCLVNQAILLSNREVCKGSDAKSERFVLLSIGKASVAMTQAAIDKLGERITKGLCVCKVLPTEKPNWKNVRLIQGAHPIPDERSLIAGKEVRDLVSGLSENEQLLVLISGGASALVVDPWENISLGDIQKMNSLLLQSGATINEINCVRKHLERLKGGGVVKLASPAHIDSLILSDVIGNDTSSIASGPTVADAYTFSDAMHVLEKYHLTERVPSTILQHLQKGMKGGIPETLKESDPMIQNVCTRIIGSNQLALEKACSEARLRGIQPFNLSGRLVGEASTAAKWFLSEVEKIKKKQPGTFMAVAGGETTVTLKGGGKGGRNLELALAGVRKLSAWEKSCLITFATDGEDGPTDAAGAFVDEYTLEKANSLGFDPEDFLKINDSYTFFEKTGGLIRTGSTGTNVNDLTFFFHFK